MISSVSVNQSICLLLFFIFILIASFPFWKRFKQELIDFNLGILASFICYCIIAGAIIFWFLKLFFPFS